MCAQVYSTKSRQRKSRASIAKLRKTLEQDSGQAQKQEPQEYCGSCRQYLKSGLCPFLGRCREPLAWSLDTTSALDQGDCPLFTTIPKEIRDMIWEYALTDCTSNPLVGERVKKVSGKATNSSRPTGTRVISSDVAFGLLTTCRAVYLEAYMLPLSCNPFIIQPLYSNATTKHLLPWQCAAIQSLDVTLMQTQLEGTILKAHLLRTGVWEPEGRSTGIYIGPSYHPAIINTRRHIAFAMAHPLTFMPANGITERHMQISDVWENEPREPSRSMSIPKSCAFRVALARPLTRLTLRLCHTDWWTWTDDPETINEDQQLGLDPTLGDGSDESSRRVTTTRMRALDAERRNRQVHGNPVALSQPSAELRTTGWRSAIGSLPDLKCLEMVMETFAEKKSQLERVVECAETWTFPINGTHHMLVWDGKVEAGQWSKGPDQQPSQRLQNAWYNDCKDFEVRIMRFGRKKF